ncbi:MAG: hypothetical protein O3A46_17350 [Candidatus Poribacteria bacterium]|nr:hypothetical protein [Candidatus Poribacteria bacterium]
MWNDNAIGNLNIAFGWVWMNFGFLTGLLMGMKAEQFGLNKLDVGPTWMGGYDSVPRRLLRLGHIAFIMLPVLNILYGNHIDAAHLPVVWKKTGSAAMIFGGIGVPVLCLLAVAVRPAKRFVGIPATAVLIANLIIAWGFLKEGL